MEHVEYRHSIKSSLTRKLVGIIITTVVVLYASVFTIMTICNST